MIIPINHSFIHHLRNDAQACFPLEIVQTRLGKSSLPVLEKSESVGHLDRAQHFHAESSLPTLPAVVTRSKYQTIFSTHRLSSSSLTWWTDNWSGRLVFSLFPDIINNLRLYVKDLNGRVWAIWVWASPLWSGDETVKWRKGERNLKIHLGKGVPTLFCKILDLGPLSALTGGRLLWRFVQLTKWNVLCAMAEDKAKPDVVFVLCFVFAAFTR